MSQRARNCESAVNGAPPFYFSCSLLIKQYSYTADARVAHFQYRFAVHEPCAPEGITGHDRWAEYSPDW